MKKTEEAMGAKFGDPKNPLLVSCRSGARVSMPGMMDTVLNIGLNESTLKGLIEKTGNERFGWDSYRRFVQMYGDVVLGLKPTSKTEIDPFEHIMEELKHEKKVQLDTDLTTADLKELVKRFKKAVKERTGHDFPEDAYDQMWGAVAAVFNSWGNDRAVVYRRQYGYPHDWGTAANICSMVFGNMGDDCCTGVAFTRDPATGEKVFYGEYLINAQGEDVVAGIRTPKKIAELQKDMPAVYKQLDGIRNTLEKHYRDVQDIEFTVQKQKLWMLQTRNGKRTGFAGVRFAVDMVEEGLITKEEALSAGRLPPDDLNQLLQPIFNPEAKRKAIADGNLLAKGINAGPGAATGRIKFHAEDAEAYIQKHKGTAEGHVILVRRETSPEDLRGMQAANGILTAFGGASSHAALVSRQMGKVCIVGCNALNIDYHKATMTVGDKVLKEGDWISIDGFTGEVMAGQIATKPSEVVQVLIEKSLKPEQSRVYQQYAKLMDWADGVRKLRIRTNADKPDQAAQADRVRRRRDRPVPHRAHVLRSHQGNARDDPGRQRRRSPQGARQAVAVPARGFRRALQGDEGLPGHDPHARSAAARVPAARRQGPRGDGQGNGRLQAGDRRPRQGAARAKPHARLPRLPPRHRLPGDHRNAGPRHHRGRLQCPQRPASRSSRKS